MTKPFLCAGPVAAQIMTLSDALNAQMAILGGSGNENK